MHKEQLFLFREKRERLLRCASKPKGLEDVRRLGYVGSAEPDEEGGGVPMRVPYAVRHAQQVSVVVAREARGDEGA